ncbi:Protein byr4 [Seiridium cupressi]
MALQLKPRQPVEDEVENWDDDDFMIDDDLTFRSASSATTANHHVNRRDSHTSFRSDRESLFGDEDRQVHLAGDDEKSTLDAISAAQHAGIPIPQNVPPSALMGGTIKRLGGRKVKKVIHDDWGDDIELPKNDQALRIKQQDASQFPETLRQVSGSLSSSPVKLMKPAVIYRSPKKESIPIPSAASTLDRFRDNDDDDDVFGDGVATIKASRFQHKPISLITPPTPRKREEDDDFELDLELPSHGKLKLSNRRDIPSTPNLNSHDDFDWGEGSLGTRFGGTRREGFSNRSSNASALSPSISSSITAESEDDAFDGLVLPVGPLDLKERLKHRKQSRSPERPSSSGQRPGSSKQRVPQTPVQEKEDILDGIDFEGGDVFSSGKMNLHRNVKVKETRQNSPARPKAAVSLTFTNKPVSSQPSRLPRPAGAHHERSHTQPSLEPVSESGGPIPYRSSRRSLSRLGHSSSSSISSIGTPATPTATTSFQTLTPRRRELGQKASLGALRTEPTTTNAQLLRLKRSLPAMKPAESPARPGSSRYERPPSRTESQRTQYQPSFRPKTPVDRTQPAPSYQGSAAQARKPFLPAGSSSTQSHHVTTRSSRIFRRHDSDFGPETRPLSRAVSRSTMRSPSPRKFRPVEKVAAEPWQQLSKPRRVKQFGDGTELDGFDDLPTSAQVESKFTKQPIPGRDRTTIRNKMYQNVLPERSTPSPVSPYSPARAVDNQPHFARDTAASRKAREVSLAQRAPPITPSTPLAPLASQRVAQLSTRPNLSPHLPHGSVRSKKSRKPPQLKPHLITNMNPAKESKVVNGMTYNPETCRWEGNENALHVFDAAASTPTTTSISTNTMRDKENTTPRPYLITNMGASSGIKREGNMVFDPTHMRWLEMSGTGEDLMEGFDALDDEDPFKDIPDLEDREPETGEGGHGRASDVGSEWLVGEEFDVGPEFIRRQREEEERWRKKCERWINRTDRNNDAWRWALRDIVQGP